jgi:hypothetical protein
MTVPRDEGPRTSDPSVGCSRQIRVELRERQAAGPLEHGERGDLAPRGLDIGHQRLVQRFDLGRVEPQTQLGQRPRVLVEPAGQVGVSLDALDRSLQRRCRHGATVPAPTALINGTVVGRHANAYAPPSRVSV